MTMISTQNTTNKQYNTCCCYPYNLLFAIFGAREDLGDGTENSSKSDIFSSAAVANKSVFELNLRRVATYARVSDRDVEVLIAHYRDGLSYQAIAKQYYDNTVSRQALQIAQHNALNKLNKEEYLEEFLVDEESQPEVARWFGTEDKRNLNDPQNVSVSAFDFSALTKSSLCKSGITTIGELARLNVKDVNALPHVYWRNAESIFTVIGELGIARPSPEILDGIDAFIKKYKMSYKNLLETVRYVINEKEKSEADEENTSEADGETVVPEISEEVDVQ